MMPNNLDVHYLAYLFSKYPLPSPPFSTTTGRQSSEHELLLPDNEMRTKALHAVPLLQQQELECTAVTSSSIFSNDMSNKYLYLQRFPLSEAPSAAAPFPPTILIITKLVLCTVLIFFPPSVKFLVLSEHNVKCRDWQWFMQIKAWE